MQRIQPCLWFNGEAEEAANFYVSLFPNSRIGRVMRWPEGGPVPAGTALSVEFELEGQQFIALNGGPQYKFTPAISLFVHCRHQDEIDALWNRLLEGGSAMQCGWLSDRYGVSWQIVPSVLGEMLRDPDPARSTRVMSAMMPMVKLDVALLQQAYEGR